MKKKALILGASGYLGTEVVNTAPDDFELYLGCRSKVSGNFVKVDLADNNSIITAFKKVNPDVVIHVARLGGYDAEPERAKDITKSICLLVKQTNAKLIYMSSDAVFDGKEGDYKEDDETNPASDYGRAKLAAEKAIKSNLVNYVIIRVGYIYGESDKRLKKLLEEIEQNGSTKRFSDMFRTPIHVTKLAMSIWKLAQLNFTGIIHLGEEKKSVFDFSRGLVKAVGLDPDLVKSNLTEDRKFDIAIDTSLNTNLAQKILQ
ncbi:sugar nucleotide-binding protein [Patescibacteria group bacterium]|nr:sugar nucleotide-binding protein [Patescibacteria group bacterium]